MTAPKRKPCLPPDADLTRRDGNCVWCNQPLPRKKDGGISRAWFWHGPCHDIAEPILMGGQQRARWNLEARDGEACADCHKPECQPLDVDHIVPLWSVDRTATDAWKFWMLGNLQLLGKPCHKKKTASEAKQRAKEKRVRDRANGDRRPRQKIDSPGFRPAPDGHKHFPPGRKFRPARKGVGA